MSKKIDFLNMKNIQMNTLPIRSKRTALNPQIVKFVRSQKLIFRCKNKIVFYALMQDWNTTLKQTKKSFNKSKESIYQRSGLLQILKPK